MPLLKDRVAVVTGAGQGIGLAIARRFVAEGAWVVIADVDERSGESAVAELGSQLASSVRCDVTSESDVDALIAATENRWGRLDVMVNNAGITRDSTMAKMSIEDFNLVLNVHLTGTWLGCRAASAAMRGHGGAIVNISSISAKVGNFGQTNYSAAKAGIVGMTKACAKEVARHGIRVNAIQPGLIRTSMTEKMPRTAWDSKMAEIPMGRAGEPEEVASVAAFLASDLASYLTGTVIEVTGGRYM
jgi:3-oxoacyl-[acyl-carrier protein] reductase